MMRSNLRGANKIPIRTVIAANPGGPGHHWIAKRYVFQAAPWTPFLEVKSKREWVYAPSTFDGNDQIDREQYLDQLESSCPDDPELLRAWRDGDWSVIRGTYFAECLSEARNAIAPWTTLPSVDEGWHIYLSHDFGSAAPSVTYIVAKSPGAEWEGSFYPRGSFVLVDELATVAEWQDANDPRVRITPDNLLRMESGLDAAETGSGFDPSSQMLYDSSNMGAFAARRPLKIPLATRWEYTSVDTLLLDRMMSQMIGGGPAEFRHFAETELFEPIGMKNVTLEFDGAGTFIGSSHVYAPARAFARLGQLFLNDGVAPDGRRILPAGWAAYSRKSTLGSNYGAGFWTNDGPSEGAAWRAAHGFPKDGYFASGDLGQRIYIVPSQNLVVARFGYTRERNFGIEADVKLIAATISALR